MRKKAYEFEMSELLLVQLLREQIVRQRVGTSEEGMDTRHFPAHEREDLVRQLESTSDKVKTLDIHFLFSFYLPASSCSRCFNPEL